mgnify:CR=1 FL=1
MLKLINMGMNHETAPVSLRESLATDPDNTPKVLSCMRNLTSVNEGLFLSTCKRIAPMFTS